MEKKQTGVCPFCSEKVQAVVVESNSVRRDICECPICKEKMLVCRIPGCHDYAKVSSGWDHEMCPACTETASEIGKKVGSVALKVAEAFALAWVTGKAGGGKGQKQKPKPKR